MRKKCKICQLSKKKSIKYGKLPPKEAESEPWDVLCVDLIGPYSITSKKVRTNEHQLWAVSMINPVTSWVEIRKITNRESFTIAEEVEQTWLAR